MKYIRNCPGCGILQTYTDVWIFKRAFKRNSRCGSCVKTGIKYKRWNGLKRKALAKGKK